MLIFQIASLGYERPRLKPLISLKELEPVSPRRVLKATRLYTISEQVVLSLSHRSCSALYGFIKYPFSQSEKKKRMTTALRSDAGSGWDCFEVPSNKYSDVSTIMERLHQESFRQTHQNDRKVLLLGHTQWRVLFMSSTGRDWASGSHIFCMTGVSQILSDISSLLFCCVGATLVHPLDWTSQLPWTGAHVLGLMCETSTDLFLLSYSLTLHLSPGEKFGI